MGLKIVDDAPLAPLTTLELGGRARHLVEAADEEAVVAALRWAADRRLSALVLGGGSNLVVADAGFGGLVVRVISRGIAYGPASSGGEVLVTAQAGEPWDALVADTVGRGLAGLECLSGIPGLAGATPIQNVGAYGQEVAETIRSVRAVERASGQVVDLSPEHCPLAYRDSAFKHEPDRHTVVAVTFGLRPGGAPSLRYAELARALATESAGGAGGAPSLAQVRATVIALRRAKSMVLDDADPNRRSVGSFFTNPIVALAAAAAVRARSAVEMPSWPAGDGVKLSAGWLIEQAGFPKGLRRGAVGISSRHALALVHHGGGTTAELLALAREIRDGVRARFGVTIRPEPVLVGDDLA